MTELPHLRRKSALAAAGFSLLLLVILALDVRSDRRARVPVSHIADEIELVGVSVIGLLTLAFLTFRNRKAPRGETDRILRFAREYKLSTSEQEITLYLLKGLSHAEIARLRETRESTVRQQAQSIYAKTGVHSKSELAALFFEDLI